MCVCMCVCVCVRACVRACMHACMYVWHACVRACMHACMHACVPNFDLADPLNRPLKLLSSVFDFKDPLKNGTFKDFLSARF